MEDLVDELSGTTLDGDGANNNRDSIKSKSSKPVNRTASIINRSKLLMLDSDTDSEADDEMGSVDKKRCSKHIRVAKQTKGLLLPGAMGWRAGGGGIPHSAYSKVLSKGKRKRNSNAEALHAFAASAAVHASTSSSISPFALSPENLFAPGPSGMQQLSSNESMDVEQCDVQHHQHQEGGRRADDGGGGGHVSDVSDGNISDDSPTEFNFDGDDEQSDFHDSSSAGHNSSSARHRNRIYSHTRSKEFKIPTNPSNPFWSVAANHVDSSHSSAISLWKRRRPLNY